MNELANINTNDLIFEPSHLTKETIKKYLCPNASEQELIMGLQIAKTFNLNPMKREVYFVKYGDKPMQVLTGYEVYLKRAERSGQYNGLEITSQGSLATGDLKAVVKVFRKDWTNPLTHEVYYNEYVQLKNDGTPNTFWKNKPVTMIKKVAISQAFRMAFPDELDGMPYTSDEVVDQERIIDIKTDIVENQLEQATQHLEKFLTKEQSNEIISIGKAKFKEPKLFKEWLMFNYNVSSVKEIKTSLFEKIKEDLS